MSTPTPASTADSLDGFGIRAQVSSGWEGRLYLRPSPNSDFSAARARAAGPGHRSGGSIGWDGETITPVLHLGNFALPGDRGDFGSGAVEVMNSRNAFVALLEYGAAERGVALFSPVGMPRPRPADFAPDALQRRLRGQLGYQRFFTVSGRAMCLYVVLGGAQRLPESCREVNAVLAGIEIA